MRVEKARVEMMEIPQGPNGLLTHTELCGRVCYKSEDRITDDSARIFVGNLIKNGHEAVLEHARVTLRIPYEYGKDNLSFLQHEMNSDGIADYLTVTEKCEGYIVSANMRAWRALFHYARVNKIVVPAELYGLIVNYRDFFPGIDVFGRHQYPVQAEWNPWVGNAAVREKHTWYSFRIICDRGISHEIVRHRPASFSQESTRYCNYSKDKFGGQITVIKPCYLDGNVPAFGTWYSACSTAERNYFELLGRGCTPQEARAVLPTSLKTEIIMTATAAEWKHFIRLRADKAAHPQMQEIALMIGKELANYDTEVFGKTYQAVIKNNELS